MAHSVQLKLSSLKEKETIKPPFLFTKVFVLYGFVIASIVTPAFVWGTDNYGTAMLKGEATNLQAFLFGPVMRIAGVVGAVFGIVRSFQQQSLQPFFIFGGIGAATVIAPKLLDAMFRGA